MKHSIQCFTISALKAVNICADLHQFVAWAHFHMDSTWIVFYIGVDHLEPVKNCCCCSGSSDIKTLKVFLLMQCDYSMVNYWTSWMLNNNASNGLIDTSPTQPVCQILLRNCLFYIQIHSNQSATVYYLEFPLTRYCMHIYCILKRNKNIQT